MNVVTRGLARGLARVARWITRTAWFPALPMGSWGPDWFQRGYPSPSSMPPLVTFPAVFTAIDGISNDIARLPMRHFRREGGEVVEVENSAALRVLEQPNGYQTRFDLMKHLIASQLYRGNGYLYAIRNRRYEIDELHNLVSDSVWPYRSGTEVFYDVGANQLAGINAAAMLTTRECFHHRMMTLGDPIIGVTPLVAAALSCSAGMAILRQSERFFNSSVAPVRGAANRRPPERRSSASDQRPLECRVQRAPRMLGEVAVLEQGLEWKPLTMTSVDCAADRTAALHRRGCRPRLSTAAVQVGRLHEGQLFVNRTTDADLSLAMPRRAHGIAGGPLYSVFWNEPAPGMA